MIRMTRKSVPTLLVLISTSAFGQAADKLSPEPRSGNTTACCASGVQRGCAPGETRQNGEVACISPNRSLNWGTYRVGVFTYGVGYLNVSNAVLLGREVMPSGRAGWGSKTALVSNVVWGSV